MSDLKKEFASQCSPWSNNHNTIWLASNIALRRNVEKFKFPGKMGGDRRQQIVNLFSQQLSHCDSFENPKVLKAEELGPLEKEFLVEQYLSKENYQGTHLGEAFIIDSVGDILTSLNVRDHIHIQEIDTKCDIEAAWGRLVEVESHFAKSLSWAFSPQFGFLTAEPFECGTGLSVSLFMQPSALIYTGKLAKVLESLNDEAILIEKFLGHPDSYIGDMLVISNNFSLGFNEEMILGSLKNFSSKLLQAENDERKKIAGEESAEIKDKVSRAYGVLVHSYQIETQEALNDIATLKLGRDLNWIKGIEIAALNELFFNCRRAHLLNLYPEQIPQDQISHKRAEFIHKSLKGMELLI